MADPIMARTEFAAALNQICTERGISPDAVIESLKTALLAAYKKDYAEDAEKIEEQELTAQVTVDPETGEFRIVSSKEDGSDQKDVTPSGFGRIAAQTAKQVIMQQVREAEKASIIDEYRSRMGELVTGMVLRMDKQNVIITLGRGQAVMPPEEQVKGEFYRLNSRLAVVIADIRETFKGEAVIVSRSDPRLVSELFAREVPEVTAGTVVIKGIARDPGVRSKVAVASTQDGVDPVGSCVGQKGVRVQAVINELNGERVDIIQYSDDPEKYLASALSPAENLKMELNDKNKTATITVPDDQLSLAIGKGGQNVKLAAKLTGYKIKLIAATSKASASATGEEEYEIDLLNIDSKVRNKLVDAGIVHLDQILGQNIDRLQEIKGIGKKSIEEIKQKLEAYQSSTSNQEDSESPQEEPKSEEASPVLEQTDQPKEE